MMSTHSGSRTLTLDLTNRVTFRWYTFSVQRGVYLAASVSVIIHLYIRQMITEAASEEDIDEALKHLSMSMRDAINYARKQALLELADALLDVKLEKAKR